VDTVRAAVEGVPDLFAENLRRVLRIRIAPIATRMSARKLNDGISEPPNRNRRHPFHRHGRLKPIATRFWPARHRQSRHILTL